VIPFYLFIVFISFVTASDSNTNAMAGLCTNGINQDEQESPAWLKVVWGVSIALMTWLLISFAGIDGIKAASNLGGFPNMFLVLIMIVGLLKISRNPQKYDVHKEDYDSSGRPIESERLSVEQE
jgi:choline-glycine betaine transporter